MSQKYYWIIDDAVIEVLIEKSQYNVKYHH